MEQVKNRNSVSRILLVGIAFLLTFSMPIMAQDAPAGDVAKGKELFNSLCAACHKRYKKSTGPALFGVADRHDTEWLYSWIKNSKAMIDAGDADAIAIYEEYKKTPMNAFPQLNNADIDNIIAYVMEPKSTGGPTGATGDFPPQLVDGTVVSNELILGALAFIFLLLIVILVLVNNTLRSIAKANGVELPDDLTNKKPLWKAFVDNQFLVIVSSILLLLVSAYFAYGYLMQVGVDQGYQPVQPIHFSHRIHAGDNKIDCKYCHSSARVSKTSGIPSLNVCMNCHKSISEVADATATPDHTKEFYDGEIAKLYDAVGWDAEDLSYTGETKPVKWVRIHNLPDFAYFNHSQHVSVAGIKCQQCHGPIEEMEVVYQHAPLTMGWCVNCHRETNVKMEGNEYYEKIHKELSKKYGVDKLTAAQMGGLECGKCHY